MSDSVWSHREQPTRLPHPWDSPGKNAGVGCHFLLQCRKVKSESEVAQSCPTLCNPMDHSLPGSSIHRIFQARVLEWGAIAFSWMNNISLDKLFQERGLHRGENQDCSCPLHFPGLSRWLSGKESTCQGKRHGFNSWVKKFPWRRKWQPTPVFLPGESHGQRSLVGYSPKDCKKSNTTEHVCTHIAFF